MREVFDLFDFWDGRDGMVDGAKVGDFLRCCGLNPTNAMVVSNGGTKKLGTHTTIIYCAELLILHICCFGGVPWSSGNVRGHYTARSEFQTPAWADI